MDEIKTFLCGHYHIILLVELLNIYIYFISLFSISSRWVGGGGVESVGEGVCLPAQYMSYRPIRLTQCCLNVVPNSNLLRLRFFVYCICIIMWHSHLNDMEIPETKRFIPKGFELGTTLS